MFQDRWMVTFSLFPQISTFIIWKLVEQKGTLFFSKIRTQTSARMKETTKKWKREKSRKIWIRSNDELQLYFTSTNLLFELQVLLALILWRPDKDISEYNLHLFSSHKFESCLSLSLSLFWQNCCSIKTSSGSSSFANLVFSTQKKVSKRKQVRRG